MSHSRFKCSTVAEYRLTTKLTLSYYNQSFLRWVNVFSSSPFEKFFFSSKVSLYGNSGNLVKRANLHTHKVIFSAVLTKQKKQTMNGFTRKSNRIHHVYRYLLYPWKSKSRKEKKSKILHCHGLVTSFTAKWNH